MSGSDKNIHEAHRSRMRNKFKLSHASMPDHEILEMLLYTVIPRKNTNPIAHALLRRFGSLHNIFSASHEALCEVEGVGESTAFFLKLLPIVWQRTESERHHATKLDDYEKIANYLVAHYLFETEESVYVLLLDAHARLITERVLFEGSSKASSINAQKLIQYALNNNATYVILAHNHPSGNAEPSDDDITTTRYLKRAFNPFQIEFTEHFVIAGKKYCPILNYIKEIRNEKIT